MMGVAAQDFTGQTRPHWSNAKKMLNVVAPEGRVEWDSSDCESDEEAGDDVKSSILNPEP